MTVKDGSVSKQAKDYKTWASSWSWGGGTRTVDNRTSNYTIVADDNNKIFTNAWASGDIQLTLPTASAWLRLTFIVVAGHYLRVNCATGDTARYIGDVTASAGYFRSQTVGNQLTVEAIDDTQWIVTSLDGTFTFDS